VARLYNQIEDKMELKEFIKDKEKGKINCSFCKKSNEFKLFYTKETYMVFECMKCTRRLLMPFKSGKAKV